MGVSSARGQPNFRKSSSIVGTKRWVFTTSTAYLVGGRAPTIVNVFPDIFRLRNWGSVRR